MVFYLAVYIGSGSFHCSNLFNLSGNLRWLCCISLIKEVWWNGCGQNKQSERIKAGDADGKIVILSVPDTKEDILKKILKVVEGSADVEEWRMPSEKIERGDLQILLPEKMVYRGGK